MKILPNKGAVFARRNRLFRILAPAIIGIFLFHLLPAGSTAPPQDKNMEYNKLSPEEEKVIVHKGTEAPFTGKFVENKESGTYTCKRCNAPLYKSEDKFDSRCGWPSFDDEIPGAVDRQSDADGMRTEILCAHCGGHLGHVFMGEGFTDKNTRHCVNSISMNFIPTPESREIETAYFAAGCFWGVEYYLQQEQGVVSTQVGYMGGHKQEPTYREVCDGSTGHAEAIEVRFDPSKSTFEKLARLFFEIHDPAQVNRQGPDIGDQYRSAIFFTDESQKKSAEKLIGILTEKGYKIATELKPADSFWKAEDYHQDYYLKNGAQPYCHSRQKKF
jgi:peptide methionine sulfoxide reductase msrA/msrB